MAVPAGAWPVGDLTQYIRARLEADPVLADVWVSGQISNVFRARSGHTYFTLRDDEGQLKSALFKGAARRSTYLPTEGDDVIAHGQVSLFPRDGTIQLYVDLVEGAGTGLDALRLELLRQTLEAEGLFDPSRKRPLPPFPRRIGVVTSPDGAVWHDIRQVVGRRFPMVELILAPSAVQGDNAPAGLVAAIAALGREPDIDLIIVGRGGGSAEDLAAFNDERVVRALFRCPVPTVSAVGHETDWSLCDLVADLRAPTPSAAAELATPSAAMLRRDVDARLHRIADHAVRVAEDARRALGQLETRLATRSPRVVVAEQRVRLTIRADRLGLAVRSSLDRSTNRLVATTAVLDALSPARTLGRGFSVVTSARSGQVVAGPDDIQPGEALRVTALGGGYDVVTAGRVAPAGRVPDRTGAGRTPAGEKRRRTGQVALPIEGFPAIANSGQAQG